MSGHHANDGTASRIRRGLHQRYGYSSAEQVSTAMLHIASQQARCERGEHEVRVAKPNYVTYIGYGRRVEPGTRYCGFCKTILPSEEGAA